MRYGLPYQRTKSVQNLLMRNIMRTAKRHLFDLQPPIYSNIARGSRQIAAELSNISARPKPRDQQGEEHESPGKRCDRIIFYRRDKTSEHAAIRAPVGALARFGF